MDELGVIGRRRFQEQNFWEDLAEYGRICGKFLLFAGAVAALVFLT